MDTESLNVEHHPEQNRFEIRVGDETAVLEYTLTRSTIVFTHTGGPPALEGKGIASRLAKAGLEHAREKGYKVRSLCSFVSGYMERHPEYRDLLD